METLLIIGLSVYAFSCLALFVRVLLTAGPPFSLRRLLGYCLALPVWPLCVLVYVIYEAGKDAGRAEGRREAVRAVAGALRGMGKAEVRKMVLPLCDHPSAYVNEDTMDVLRASGLYILSCVDLMELEEEEAREKARKG